MLMVMMMDRKRQLLVRVLEIILFESEREGERMIVLLVFSLEYIFSNEEVLTIICHYVV